MHLQLAIALLFGLTSLARCQTCQTHVLDIVLIIDASGSIGIDNYNLALNATASMIDNLNIGPAKIRVGIINYSSSAIAISTLVDSDQIKDILKANVANMQYLSQMTATGDALALAKKLFFNNPRVATPRVAVLFTDGFSNEGSDVYTQADLLKKQQVDIFTVGIGSGINHNELDQISSVPISTYKKLISSYKELYAAINSITLTACSTPAFLNISTKVQVVAEKDEVRNYQVDLTNTKLFSSDLYKIEMTTRTGICILGSVNWLTSTRSEVVYSQKVMPNERINADGSRTFFYYETAPPNAIRLYCSVKCIDALNEYELLVSQV